MQITCQLLGTRKTSNETNRFERAYKPSTLYIYSMFRYSKAHNRNRIEGAATNTITPNLNME